MDNKGDGRGYGFKGDSGLRLKCRKCGCELPLLHPHIMLERTDDDENLICEECFQSLAEEQARRPAGEND